MKEKISILGIGGGGQNIVDYLYQNNQNKNIKFIIINSDEQVLKIAKAPNKYILSDKLYPKFIYKIYHFFNKKPSFGCGGDVEKGEKLAEIHKKEIQKLIAKSDIVVLISCFGGGCGTGATPVVAEMLKNKGIKTMAIVTTPFDFECPRRNKVTPFKTKMNSKFKDRMEIALEGLKNLQPYVEKPIILENTKLLQNLTDKTITLREAFNYINKEIAEELYKIIDIV